MSFTAGYADFPTIEHSQTTITRQPLRVKSRRLRLSLSLFAENFSIQNEFRDFGTVDLAQP